MVDARNGTAVLPWAVRRGVIVGYGRVAPPRNRDPDVRRWTRNATARLARIPAPVWSLPVAWRRYAGDLDRAAHVPVVPINASDEARAHARIAAHLKSAARLLRGDAVSDPALDTMLWAVWSQDRARYPWWARTALNSHPELAPQDTARFSDFLRLAAAMLEGERGWVYGIHHVRAMPGFAGLPAESQHAGADGAAMVAFDRVSRFMRYHTGKPHADLVAEIVIAYHPTASDRREAWARSARLKTGKRE